MNDRRRHPRHVVPQPAEAVLDVRRAVAVTQVGPTEFACVGGGRCSVGDELTLSLVGADAHAWLRTCVVGMRPIAFEGTLQHEIRLRARGGVTVRLFCERPVDAGDRL